MKSERVMFELTSRKEYFHEQLYWVGNDKRSFKKRVGSWPACVARPSWGFTGRAAEKIGISRQTYNVIETGKKDMNWPIFLSLTAIFQNNEETNLMLNNISDFEEGLMRILGSATDN